MTGFEIFDVKPVNPTIQFNLKARSDDKGMSVVFAVLIFLNLLINASLSPI